MASESQGIDTDAYAPNEDYWELKESPRASYRPDGASMVRTFILKRRDTEPNDHEQTFLNQLVGYPYMVAVGGGPGQAMRRWLPDSHPGRVNEDGFAFLFATEILSTEPFQPTGQDDQFVVPVAGYSFVKIQAVYSTLPYDVRTLDEVDGNEYARFVRKRSKGSAEYLSSQFDAFVYGNDDGTLPDNPAPVDGGVGVIVGQSAVDYEWFDVHEQGFNRTRIERAYGTVNAAAFDGRDAETLLLLSGDFDPVMGPTGLRTYKVTLHFLFKYNEGHGHNWVLSNTGRWRRVVRQQDAPHGIYLTSDFTQLFVP